MEISGLQEAIQALYEAQVRQAAGTSEGKAGVSFRDCMDKAVKKEENVFPEGKDVVMGYPPQYATKYGVDMSKAKEKMTMDEYKQYICNVVSTLPVSAGMKASGSGALILKEEAFESMKADPEYEEAVIDMLRETYAAEVSPYMPNVGFQVIGASKEECYGSVIPLKNYGLMTAVLNNSLSGLGLGSLGISGLDLGGLGTSVLGEGGFGALGLGSLGTSMLGMGNLGSSVFGLGSLGTSSLGLGSMGVSVLGLGSMGASGLGLGSMGASVLGLGASALGLGSLGTPVHGLTGRNGAGSAYGNNYANMVNAYKKTADAKNGNIGIREYKSKWRD